MILARAASSAEALPRWRLSLIVMLTRAGGVVKREVVGPTVKVFWRILISYMIIGWLMAFPSYRLGLQPKLAILVFAVVTAFGLYHATVAARASRQPPEDRQDR